MRDWRERGRSVLFITHRLREVIDTCDRATILRDGVNVGTMVPQEGGETRIVEIMLGPEAARAEEQAAETSEDEARARSAARRVEPVEAVLEADDLRLGSVQGISFALRPGEVLGIAALEGQGQDELFEASPDSGSRREARSASAGSRSTPGTRTTRSAAAWCSCRPTGCCAPPPEVGPRERRGTPLQLTAPLGPDQRSRREPKGGAGGRGARRSTSAPGARCDVCRAETSRRSRSRAGSPRASRCSCATTRRGGSTWGRSDRCTGSCASLAEDGARDRLLQLGADGAPARLRPRAHDLRRSRDRGASGRGRRRGNAAPVDARARCRRGCGVTDAATSPRTSTAACRRGGGTSACTAGRSASGSSCSRWSPTGARSRSSRSRSTSRRSRSTRCRSASPRWPRRSS